MHPVINLAKTKKRKLDTYLYILDRVDETTVFRKTNPDICTENSLAELYLTVLIKAVLEDGGLALAHLRYLELDDPQRIKIVIQELVEAGVLALSEGDDFTYFDSISVSDLVHTVNKHFSKEIDRKYGPKKT